MEKPPKIRKDGELDNRGHSDGSKPTRFGANDGRRRPGRPKGARDEKSEVLLIRDMPVEVTNGTRKQTTSTRLAILMRQRRKALDGDQRSSEYMLNKFSQFEPPLVEPDLTRVLIEEDQAILAYAASRGLFSPAAADSDAVARAVGINENEAADDD